MSSWRVLELAEQPDGEPIPQLLVKPDFTSHSYRVFLTCLTSIWCEELHLDAIVDRAAAQQSPIDVSKQDTAQLAILLDNVSKSLSSPDHGECRLTREGADGITLHTTVRLPEPLDSLTWTFHLQKRSSVTLKNELILPLLVSSHIQYERINDLITTIENKDNAITRLVDSFESNNLDLAAAFPSIGGLKTGRKLIKREQAARHLPALRSFQQTTWREETAQLADSDVTTLGLFQEALVQCTSEVPSSLQADEGAQNWLAHVPSRLTYAKPAVKIRTHQPLPRFQPPKHGHESSPVDEDTDDEFEVHHNFKTRNLPHDAAKPPPPPALSSRLDEHEIGDDDSTEEEDDLDAPSQNHNKAQTSKPPQTHRHTRSSTPPIPAEPVTSPPPVSARSKGRGFRIGGKAKQKSPEPSLDNEDRSAPDPGAARDATPAPAQVDTQVETSPKKPRKPFRIGGRNKASQDAASSQPEIPALPLSSRFTDAHSPTPNSSPPLVPQEVREEVAPVEEAHAETAEEKVERKRAELKRRNEEVAKKQAQHKKKKRF